MAEQPWVRPKTTGKGTRVYQLVTQARKRTATGKRESRQKVVAHLGIHPTAEVAAQAWQREIAAAYARAKRLHAECDDVVARRGEPEHDDTRLWARRYRASRRRAACNEVAAARLGQRLRSVLPYVRVPLTVETQTEPPTRARRRASPADRREALRLVLASVGQPALVLPPGIRRPVFIEIGRLIVEMKRDVGKVMKEAAAALAPERRLRGRSGRRRRAVRRRPS